MKRAYRTTWKGVTSIVAAEYDGWAAVDESKHCWAEDQLENCRDKKQNSSR